MTSRATRIARWVWPAFAAAELLIAAAAVPSALTGLLTPGVRAELPAWHLTAQQFVVDAALVQFAPALVFLAAAIVVWWRAPREPIAIACAYMLIAFGFVLGGPGAAADSSVGPELPWATALAAAAGQLAVATFFFVFPTGTFVPRAFRWVAVVGAGFLVALTLPVLVAGRFVTADAVQSTGLALFLLGVAAQIIRYRRTTDAAQRAQVRWVVYGIALTAVVAMGSRLLLLLLPAAAQASQVGATLVGGGVFVAALTIVPVCITIAVLRAGLWNVDRVVNRTMVYGLLTLLVVLVYVVVVSYLGVLMTTATLLPSLIATGVVAIALQPLRRLLQRGVNRLMYGLRDEPDVVVAALGRRLEVTADPDVVLPEALGALTAALKVPSARLVLRDGSTIAIGVLGGEPTSTPLAFQGRAVGTLELAGRRPGDPLTPRDLILVQRVAPQLAAAADAVLLTRDLRRSRSRIVEAREEERRRLRRDLHDGLGPALAGLALQAGSISGLAVTDPAAAARMGDQVASGVRTVIGDVRRLVYGLRPPALDEYGLVEGLHQAIATLERPGSFTVTVESPDPLPPLPAGVEVAAYRIVLEAVANAARHSGASRCTVVISGSGDLLIEVADDGTGIDPGSAAGVGILGMRERAAEVDGQVELGERPGGGTLVVARLPLPLRSPAGGAHEELEPECVS